VDEDKPGNEKEKSVGHVWSGRWRINYLETLLQVRTNKRKALMILRRIEMHEGDRDDESG